MGDNKQLQRNLSNRHIQLIAIGGAIGTGLFMGAGRSIHLAGPSIIFAYMIIGLVLYLVMRAMGEVLLANQDYGTFSDFIADLIGPTAGFIVGWTYWLCWIVTGIAEVVAVVGYVQFWWPNLPAWIPSLLTIAVLFLLNIATVKAFGETEFWFAMIKVVAIIALIIVGVAMVLIGFTSPDGTKAMVSNLWSHPGANGSGIFPNGLLGFLAGFQLAIFSFVGIELVGTTAAETKEPTVTLPKAIRSIPIRVLLFYVFALLAIMVVTPWNNLDPNSSPFVYLFSLAGIAGAASLVNMVVLSSAASACNSGVYSTSRMLHSLAKNQAAPRLFKRLSKRQIPENAVILSAICLMTAIVLLNLGDTVMDAFTLVTSVASVLFLFVWGMIVAAYVAFRKKHAELHEQSIFQLPGGYLSVVVIFLFIAAMLVVLGLDPFTFKAMLVSLIWFAGIGVAALVHRQRLYNN